MTVSTVSGEVLIPSLPNLVWWYIIISQNVLLRNGIVVFKVKVTANFKMSMNVCPDDIFWIAEAFNSKLGIGMHHYQPGCYPKRLVCCFKVKVTVKDHIIKIWLSNISSEVLIILPLNLVWWHIIMVWWHIIIMSCEKIGLLCWGQGQGHRKVQNSSKCWSGRYFGNCWTFHNQTW